MKILVTCGRLTNGGVQRSLLNFLKLISDGLEDSVLLLPSSEDTLVADVPTTFRVAVLPDELRQVSEAGLTRAGIWPAARRPWRAMRAFLGAVSHSGCDRGKAARLFRESYAAAFEADFAKLEIGFEPDLIVQYAGGQGIWDALIISRFPNVPKIVWIHGDIARFGSGTLRQRRLLGAYDGAVAVSSHGSKQLVEAVPELKGRTEVIENHIDLEAIDRAAQEPVDDVSFTRLTLCSVTRLTEGKAVDVGIRAARLLADRGVDFQWLIIGDGGRYESLRELIRKLGLERQVLLLGWRSNPHKYVSRSNVFVHTSRSEGKSVAIAEALALAKPVVVTRYPSVGDQVVHGSTGLISELSPRALADVIEQLLHDGSLMALLSETTRALNLRGTGREELMNLLDTYSARPGYDQPS